MYEKQNHTRNILKACSEKAVLEATKKLGPTATVRELEDLAVELMDEIVPEPLKFDLRLPLHRF